VQIVGDSLRKGISGGERKRLAVAMELITDPILLFLDEPTSGLDSVTAFGLCQQLKGLTDAGRCTVVMTVHQPSSKLFCLIDNLLVLKTGTVVYMVRPGPGHR
jgi:ABC-type multidrug transport system ATPase subunit